MTDELTPGFYQGRLRGNATGRLSPREAQRPPRADIINARHGIVSFPSIDPHQGSLWHPDTVPARPSADIVRSHGIPEAPPGGGHRGFMPGVQRSTPEKTRAAKVTAVEKLGTALARTGVSRGGPPVKETIENRLNVYAKGKPAPWYSHTEDGTVKPGEASTLIGAAAERQGVSHATMTRAVAITSPRTAWDDENDLGGHSGGRARPNLQSAENVVSRVRQLPSGADEATIRAAGESAYGKSLNQPKGKAAVEVARGEPTGKLPIVDQASQKVPNFEQSLHLDHVSPHVQQQAAKSYTVDVHDTTSFGGDETMLKTDLGYHVAAMTGRRAALKVGELPPNFQASTWNVIRDAAGPASVGDHRLFKAVPRGPKLGDLLPNPKAMPPDREHLTNAIDQARPKSFAEKMGIEF